MCASPSACRWIGRRRRRPPSIGCCGGAGARRRTQPVEQPEMAVPNIVPANAHDVPLSEVTSTPDLPAAETTVTQVSSPPALGTTLVLATDGAAVTGRRSGAIVRAPNLILHSRPDSRFSLPRATSEQLLDRLVLESPLLGPPPRTAIVVAHPDDEAIGAGALM